MWLMFYMQLISYEVFKLLGLCFIITHPIRHEITGSLGRAEGRRDLFEVGLSIYTLRAEAMYPESRGYVPLVSRIYSLRVEDI